MGRYEPDTTDNYRKNELLQGNLTLKKHEIAKKTIGNEPDWFHRMVEVSGYLIIFVN